MKRWLIAWVACFLVTFLLSGAIASLAIMPFLGAAFGDLLRPRGDASSLVLRRQRAAGAAAVALSLLFFANPASAKMEFDQYQLIILRTVAGAKELSKEEHKTVFEGHLGHFRKMAAAGKLKVCGPFGDQDDKTAEGLCLYQVGSVAEARKLAEEDPAVKAGQIKVEAMTWYCEKGGVAFPLVEKR